MISRGKYLVDLALKKHSSAYQIENQKEDPNNDSYRQIQIAGTQLIEKVVEPSHTPILDISCNESDGFMYENEDELGTNSDIDIDNDDDVRDKDWVLPKKRPYESSEESSDDECEGRGPEKLYNDANTVVIESTLSDQVKNLSTEIPIHVDHEEIVGEEEHNKDKKNKKRNNKRKYNQKLRMEGKAYFGIDKKATGGKAKYAIPRSERIMKERPCKQTCVKGKGGKTCMLIDDNTRQTIFNAFWKELDWHGKKVFALGLIDKAETARKTKNSGISRRRFTYKYHLKKDGARFLVCKALFISTLGVTEDEIRDWLSAAPNTVEIPKSPQPPDKTKDTKKTKMFNEAKEFLTEIPKMPSHYCRSETSKLYLESSFTSISEVHREYLKQMSEKGKTSYNITRFTEIFKEMNLALFQPKKDQCDLCCAYKAGNIQEDVYLEHIKDKDDARNAKSLDKERAISCKDIIVITMDLQSLLLCPKLEASCMYYKTKLCCHNFTFYNLASSDVSNYFWNETATDLRSSTFATCIIDYLESLSLENIEGIILYSDGCAYQNRNVTLSNALRMFSMRHNTTVEQKFLIRGHTQMECDSVHSTIEKSLRKKEIYVPQQYVDCIREARKSNKYKVKYVSHEFFKDYGRSLYYTSIRPGMGAGSHVVTDIRQLRYTSDGNIGYKTNHNDNGFTLLRKPRLANEDLIDVPCLFDMPLSLKKTKYDHLQQMKNVIPKDYHAFFDALPHT